MLWPPKGTSVCQTTCFELQMLNIFLYLWFVHETKRIVCMLVSKNWNVPYLPSQNGLTVFFCQILHYNSTPQRKDITRRLLNIFNIFSRFLFTEWSNLPYSIYCAKLKWLLTQILHYRAYAWKWNFFLQFCGPRSHPRAPIGVKFCVANKRTHVPHGSAKFHVNRCNESPLGAKMVIFGLWANLITAVCRFEAILQVITS